MTRHANAGLVPGARQEFQQREEAPADIPQPGIGHQVLVVGNIDNNNPQYRRAVFATRLRLLGTVGFPRRRRWLAPFTATVFALERRQIGAVLP
jgi:hypothetical protein